MSRIRNDDQSSIENSTQRNAGLTYNTVIKLDAPRNNNIKDRSLFEPDTYNPDHILNKSQSNRTPYDDISKIVDELPVLMTIPKITREYIAKMKNIVKTSNDKKEVHKYTKWILCMTYLIPVITMYTKNDDRLKHFIRRNTDFKESGCLNVMDGYFTYYDVLIPDETLSIDLSDLAKHDVDEGIISFVHTIITNKKSREARILSKMFNHIYFVICNVKMFVGSYEDCAIDNPNTDNVQKNYIMFCWQFKDPSERRKIEKTLHYSRNQLVPQIDLNSMYLKFDANEVVSQLIDIVFRHDNDTTNNRDELRSSLTDTVSIEDNNDDREDEDRHPDHFNRDVTDIDRQIQKVDNVGDKHDRIDTQYIHHNHVTFDNESSGSKKEDNDDVEPYIVEISRGDHTDNTHHIVIESDEFKEYLPSDSEDSNPSDKSKQDVNICDSVDCDSDIQPNEKHKYVKNNIREQRDDTTESDCSVDSISDSCDVVVDKIRTVCVGKPVTDSDDSDILANIPLQSQSDQSFKQTFNRKEVCDNDTLSFCTEDDRRCQNFQRSKRDIETKSSIISKAVTYNIVHGINNAKNKNFAHTCTNSYHIHSSRRSAKIPTGKHYDNLSNDVCSCRNHSHKKNYRKSTRRCRDTKNYSIEIQNLLSWSLMSMSVSFIFLYIYSICVVIKFFFNLDMLKLANNTVGLPGFILHRLSTNQAGTSSRPHRNRKRLAQDDGDTCTADDEYL